MYIYKLQQLDGEGNREYVYRSLRESIIKATIKPGETISEPQLQQYFNVSRSPIREALSILQHENLIKVEPKKKTSVVLIDREYILESRLLRCRMEKEVLLNICTKMDTAPLVKELTEIIKKAEELINKKDSIKIIFDYDTLFHATIFKYSGLKYVWDMIRTSNIQYNRFLNLYIEEKLYGKHFIHDHKMLIKWLKNKQIESLIDYTNNNFDRIAVYLKEIEARHPDYFLPEDTSEQKQ
ncbi:MAG: GntR family transcriptional regulator [Acidaminococcaceae bacterium]|jgi:DNA-binding GntR family transcriptional regulator|nr:GntR family transcriptional regulator [Acidaminococcaceae bacterium]